MAQNGTGAAKLRAGAKRVEVEWFDSKSHHGWHPEDDIIRDAADHDHMLCVTVGYLLHEDDEKVVLVHSFARQGLRSREVLGTVTIPRSAICGGPFELRR